MRFLKMAAVTVAVLAATAGSTIVASAYPSPEYHSLDCDPGNISAHNGSCTLVFVEKEPSGPAKGQLICFSATAGTVTPPCSETNSKGKATATYNAGTAVSCSGEAPGRKVVIRGTENADDATTAQTTVMVKCPDTRAPVLGSSTSRSSHGTTVKLTNTAARISNPTASVGGIALGGGILLVIAFLSVTITGRLRLRGLRR